MRFAVWFQGCPLRCPGCCNPEMLRFEGGTLVPLAELIERLRATAAEAGGNLEGLTLLGGEPTAPEHAGAAAALADAARELGLGVMVFSGHLREELERRAESDPSLAALLARTDILVDGPYLRDQPETRRRWIGSANQRIHFLSDRNDPADPRWTLPNTLEVRLSEGRLTVNGFPAAGFEPLWKRPPRPANRATRGGDAGPPDA